jgi:hypothetical protein
LYPCSEFFFVQFTFALSDNLLFSHNLTKRAIRFATFGSPRDIPLNTIYSAASTAANVSIVVYPSTPEYAEAFVAVSLLTAGNIARFTVVTRDAYGNKVFDPAFRSAFLLIPQAGGDAVMPVSQTSNEVHYLIQSEAVSVDQSVLN